MILTSIKQSKNKISTDNQYLAYKGTGNVELQLEETDAYLNGCTVSFVYGRDSSESISLTYDSQKKLISLPNDFFKENGKIFITLIANKNENGKQVQITSNALCFYVTDTLNTDPIDLPAYQTYQQEITRQVEDYYTENVKTRVDEGIERLDEAKADANKAAASAQSAKETELSVDKKVQDFSNDYVQKTNEFNQNAQTKTTEFNQVVSSANESIDSKVTKAQQSATNAKQSENNAKQSVNEINDFKNIVDQSIIKSNAKGNPIVINDSINAKLVDMTINGSTKQNPIRNLNGTVISADKVSPNQIMPTRVESANLIPFPYYSPLNEINGLTFSYDNELIINGTATKTTYFVLIANIDEKRVHVKKGSYTFSITPQSGVVYTFPNVRKDGTTINYYETANKRTITVDDDSYVIGSLVIQSGTVLSNYKPKPIFNKGTEPLPYTPYVSNLETTKLKVKGTNLLDNQPPLKPAGNVDLLDFGHNVKFNGKITVSFDTEDLIFETTGAFLFRFRDTTTADVVDTPTGKNLGFTEIGVPYNKHIEWSTNNPKAFSKFQLAYWSIGSGKFKNVQLQLGDATPFEKEKIVIYDVSKDGTVANVQSISPNMTLMSDTDGVLINTLIPEPIVNGMFTQITNIDKYTLSKPIELSKWDRIVKRDGVWGKENNTSKKELTDFKNVFSVSSKVETTEGAIAFSLNATKQNRDLICDKFENIISGDIVRCARYENTLYFSIKGVLTKEEWIAQMNLLKPTIVYPKEVLSFEPLPQVDQDLLNNLETHYPKTVISTDDGIVLDVKYLADTKNYVDNEKPYELIEKFTMQENVPFERRNEPDGTPYKFKKIRVQFTFATREGAVNLYLSTNQTDNALYLTTQLRNVSQILMDAKIENKLLNGYVKTSDGTYYLTEYLSKEALFVPCDYLTRLRSYQNIPTNTIIEIWGVRA